MARNASGKPIVLIMDGHGSHSTDKMREYGYSCEPREHIYLLPPHTTHRLQPLDSSAFGVGQRRWSKLCDQRAMEGNLVTRDTVVSEWMDLRPTFLSQDIVLSSWRQTGLFRLNPGIFRAEDFAPSHTYSVKSHLPAGYPSVQLTDSDLSDLNEESETTKQVSSYVHKKRFSNAKLTFWIVHHSPPQSQFLSNSSLTLHQVSSVIRQKRIQLQ